MKNKKAEIFQSVLETFENLDIKQLTQFMIDEIPTYFFDVGASSTGKYHPQYALGDLGVARHTIALVRFMNHMFTIEQTQKIFNSRERDLLRMAGIMHDSRKSGEAEGKSAYTVFNHPLLAAEAIRKFKGIVQTVTDKEIELAAKACESHMGQWNTDKRSTVTLPKPEGKYSELLHLCDYLASRKDIEMRFDQTEVRKPESNIEEYRMTFGKYKNELILDVAKEHKDYLEWMQNNLSLKEPLKIFVQKLVG